jgi:hypothetical protein
MTADTVDDFIKHAIDDLIDAPFVAKAATLRAVPALSYHTNQVLMAQVLVYLTQTPLA